MSIFFINKPFFFAFAGIAALLAIYLLFRLAKPVVVSSLMLWERHFASAPRGWAMKKVPLPPTFWVELLILIFLIIAAASPRIPRQSGAVATIILDDSYSMRATAEGANSAIRSGEDKLREIRGNHSHRRFRIILAGSKPTNLGMAKEESDFISAVKLWKCDSAFSDISAAVALAKKLSGGAEGRVFVITDHPPLRPKSLPLRMDWLAFGRPRDNLGIVKISRSKISSRGEKLIALVANLGKAETTVNVTLKLPGTPDHPESTKCVDIPAGETAKIAFTLPVAAGESVVFIQSDDLKFDDQATALAENCSPLRVAVAISDRELRGLVAKALKLQNVSIVAKSSAELIIGDRGSARFADIPQVVIPASKAQSTAVAGPYSLNKSNALTNGLNLNNTIWCLRLGVSLRGDPIAFAGDKALVSIDASPGKAQVVTMNYSPRGSTLQHTPNWPILICNLVDWALKKRAGLERRNFKCGESVNFTTPKGVKSIVLSSPDGSEIAFGAGLSEIPLPSEHPGKYIIKAGEQTLEYIVHPVNYDESDLSQCGYGHFSAGLDADTLDDEFVDVSWVAILAALVLLFLHGWMIRKSRLTVCT